MWGGARKGLLNPDLVTRTKFPADNFRDPKSLLQRHEELLSKLSTEHCPVVYFNHSLKPLSRGDAEELPPVWGVHPDGVNSTSVVQNEGEGPNPSFSYIDVNDTAESVIVEDNIPDLVFLPLPWRGDRCQSVLT